MRALPLDLHSTKINGWWSELLSILCPPLFPMPKGAKHSYCLLYICVLTSTTVTPQCFLCIVAVWKYCKAFTVQIRVQYDSHVRRVDARPPTAAQTAPQPRAQESLEMLCIIHVHTRSICPNTHFLVSVLKICLATMLATEPDLR